MKKKQEQVYEQLRERTAISIKDSTKKELDRCKAPGQCYDGFICQLVDLWETACENRMKTI